MIRFSKRARMAAAAAAFALALPAGPAKTEPVTVGIAIGLGTGLVVAIAYDQFTANYLAISLGYATPQPDAQLVWKLGRQTAIATDVDLGPPGPPVSVGQAYTDIGYIWDTLDPISLSKGNYYNASRTYKNGALKDAEVGGNPPPGGAQATAIRVDIANLPLENKIKIDMHTGKIGSYDSVFGGGAQYIDGVWHPWDSRDETDPTVSSYLAGSILPSPDSDIPSYPVPSTNEMFAANEASAYSVDWFPYFLSAVLSAGTYFSGGKEYYNPISFEVPLSAPVDAYGSWYSSAQILAPNQVPEPPAALIFAIGALMWLVLGRRQKDRKAAL
jgi:hypothetical protein